MSVDYEHPTIRNRIVFAAISIVAFMLVPVMVAILVVVFIHDVVALKYLQMRERRRAGVSQ